MKGNQRKTQDYSGHLLKVIILHPRFAKSNIGLLQTKIRKNRKKGIKIFFKKKREKNQ